MRPIVILLFVLLLFWLIGASMCHNAACPMCDGVAKGAIIPAAAEGADLSINVNDQDLNFTSATGDNLLFANSSCEYTTPLSPELQEVFKNTIQHLNDNTERILGLTGLYEGEETNGCNDVADLGIARAEQVKQLLVQMGAPEERIEIDASEIRDLNEHKDMIVGGVDYVFRSNEYEEPAMTEEVALRTDKIILYFDSNKQEINLTEEQRNYLDRLMAYLEQNPDEKASVTGHTDDRGDDEWNMRLSRKRSEFVRDFMIEQGILSRQITNEGIGPDQPIESNATEEGRAKNRRVEITLL